MARTSRSNKKARGGKASRRSAAPRKPSAPDRGDDKSGDPRARERTEVIEQRPGHLACLALAALSGCLIFLATADFDIWPLAWIALAPLLLAIDRASSRRRALTYGFVTGLVCNAGGFYWIASLLERFANMPWIVGALGVVLLSAYQGLVFWLFAAAVRGIRRNSRERLGRPLPMALVAPVAMVTFEILMPFIFPWYLAITQAWNPAVIQIAELTGPVGVTALLLASSGALYDALSERQARRRWLPVAVAGVAIAGALAFGVVRMGQIDALRAEAPGVTVGVVQGNIAFNMKGLNRADLAARQLDELQQVSKELEGGSHTGFDRNGNPITDTAAELIVWTESSYPYSIPRESDGDVPPGRRGRIREGFDAPLIFGAVTRSMDRETYPYPFNTALMLDRDGRFSGRFDKIFLLMFGEYIPGLEQFPFVRKLVPSAAGHFARGKEIVSFPFELDGEQYRLGPMICYEDILTDFGRELAGHHPHLLINVTNDAWFGDTAEPWQHLALSVFRAVEVRADLVRAVNTGVSAFIDANGRVYGQTYAMDPLIDDVGACAADGACRNGYRCQENRCRPAGMEGLLGEATLLGGPDGAGHTVYASVGDLFGFGCAALCLFGWLVWPRLRSQRDLSVS